MRVTPRAALLLRFRLVLRELLRAMGRLAPFATGAKPHPDPFLPGGRTAVARVVLSPRDPRVSHLSLELPRRRKRSARHTSKLTRYLPALHPFGL